MAVCGNLAKTRQYRARNGQDNIRILAVNSIVGTVVISEEPITSKNVHGGYGAVGSLWRDHYGPDDRLCRSSHQSRVVRPWTGEGSTSLPRRGLSANASGGGSDGLNRRRRARLDGSGAYVGPERGDSPIGKLWTALSFDFPSAGLSPWIRPDPDSATEWERSSIRDRAIATSHLPDVAQSPVSCADTILSKWAMRFERLLVHLDVDVIDFDELPLAENYSKNEGLSYSHTLELLEVLLKSKQPAPRGSKR